MPDGVASQCKVCKNSHDREIRRNGYTQFRERTNEYNVKYRQQILALLGGKCTRCNFEDWRALQIDHINGGGFVEDGHCRNSAAFYLKVLLDNTNSYQLLCANCNWIKRYENNEVRGG